MDDDCLGLSAKNRHLIVSIIFILLVFFGPLFEPWAAWVRVALLVSIPTTAWLILRHWGTRSDIDWLTNDRINRGVLAAFAGALVVAAYQYATASHHFECTQYSTGGGSHECVGELIMANGPDKGATFVLLAIAWVVFWCAVSRRSNRT